jgi:hypothetical protein
MPAFTARLQSPVISPSHCFLFITCPACRNVPGHGWLLQGNVAANLLARWCETFGEHDVVAEKAIRRPMGDSE